MTSHTSPENAFKIARRYLDQKQYADAYAILRELTKRLPENLEYGETLLEVLWRQKKIDEMTNHFQEMTDRFNPTDDPVYDAIYIDALRATSNPAMPLRRMLRFYELVRQLDAALPLTGDIAECGCFRGMSSFLLCTYIRRSDPAFDGTGYHIFDSFQGLGQPSMDDEIPVDHTDAKRLSKMSRQGAFAASLDTVKHSLTRFPGIEYHPGWIPLTFQGLAEKTYRFVHVDVDHYDPTWACLEYFYPRLVSGGVLVSDDYSWPGARKAIDEFCSEQALEFTVTEYQQAVLRKNG